MDIVSWSRPLPPLSLSVLQLDCQGTDEQLRIPWVWDPAHLYD